MYNNLKESANAIREITEETNSKIESSMQKRIDEANDARYDRDMIVENRKILNDRARSYKESVTEKLLGTAFKAIYITALEQTTDLSKDDYKLAENMVDKYISENCRRSRRRIRR